MTADEVIDQIKKLPPKERAQVAKFVVENDDSWIPDEFKEAMADVAAVFRHPERMASLSPGLTRVAGLPRVNTQAARNSERVA